MSESGLSATDVVLPTGRQTLIAALAALFGWGLDLFDLFILLYVAPIVGKLFFPATQPMLSLAGAYASFGITLLVRPLGSALFGSYADRSGRRRALLVAVTGVGLTTAVFGLLPSVAQIGWTASWLFLFFRLVQGIFVGGVVASSHTIGTESVPERWRGLMSGAIGGGGSAFGGLLASFVFFVVTTIAPGDAFAAWGWRLMFISGLLTSLVGLLLFRSLDESPFFKALERVKGTHPTIRSPLGALFSRPYLKVFLVNLLMTVGTAAGYYLTSGYLPTFLGLVNQIPNATASLILIGANLAAALGGLLCGELSQHIGRRPVFLMTGVARLAFFPLLFIIMGHAELGDLTWCAMALTFIANGSFGPLLIFLNERFPTGMRASGTGLSWNIGFAIGGMTPTFVSLAASGPQALPMTLAIFSAGLSIVFIAGALIIPETRGSLLRG